MENKLIIAFFMAFLAVVGVRDDGNVAGQSPTTQYIVFIYF